MTISLDRSPHARTTRSPRPGRPSGLARPGTGRPAAGRAMIMAGIVLIAANLRLGVSSTGPLLGQLQDRMHLNSGLTSLLPTLWVVIFAFVGPAGSWLARRHGAGSVLAASLAVLVAGSAVRGIPDTPGLLAGSVLAGIGIALGNVLLPVAVRKYFPDRIGAVTGVYSTVLTLGAMLAAGTAVPLSDSFGSPSDGLAFWAVPALAAMGVWGLSRGHRRHHDTRAAHPAHGPAAPHISLRTAAKSKLAWAMVFAFGLQSMAGYVIMGWLPTVMHEAGMSQTQSGTMLSLCFAVSAPFSFFVPLHAARKPSQKRPALVLSAFFAAGVIGLIFAPVSLAYLWVTLIGIGMTTFPLVLTLIGLRGGSAAGTAALSSFSQSVGYLIAALWPVTFGILGHALGSWTVPLAATAVIALVQGVLAAYVGSPKRRTLAAELEAAGPYAAEPSPAIAAEDVPTPVPAATGTPSMANARS